MSASSEENAELICRAEDSLRAARSLPDNGFPDFAASRAYYAAFYAVSALLLKSGKQFRRHSALLAAFQSDYVKTGRIAADHGRAFQTLSEMRHLGDYGGPAHVGPRQAQEALTSALALVAAVRGLLGIPAAGQ